MLCKVVVSARRQYLLSQLAATFYRPRTLPLFFQLIYLTCQLAVVFQQLKRNIRIVDCGKLRLPLVQSRKYKLYTIQPDNSMQVLGQNNFPFCALNVVHISVHPWRQFKQWAAAVAAAAATMSLTLGYFKHVDTELNICLNSFECKNAADRQANNSLLFQFAFLPECQKVKYYKGRSSHSDADLIKFLIPTGGKQ